MKNHDSKDYLVLAQKVGKLMEIVEGCLGERWTANGKRLVDTREWCALYVAWKKLTNK